MTSELRPAGKTILSCGHEDIDGCMGVSVQFEDEDCVAGEGFFPVTVYAQYCHDCAKTLYYELGKDTGRVEAGLVQEEQAAELAKYKALAETLAGALGKIAPIRVHNGPDYAEVYFADGKTHATQAMTMNPQDWLDLSEALRQYKEARDV